MLNHPQTPDSLRRMIESTLLVFKRKLLHALPPSHEKTAIRKEVEDIVNGAVLLETPDELAWSIYIDGLDLATNGMILTESMLDMDINRSSQKATTSLNCRNIRRCFHSRL